MTKVAPYRVVHKETCKSRWRECGYAPNILKKLNRKGDILENNYSSKEGYILQIHDALL